MEAPADTPMRRGLKLLQRANSTAKPGRLLLLATLSCLTSDGIAEELVEKRAAAPREVQAHVYRLEAALTLG